MATRMKAMNSNNLKFPIFKGQHKNNTYVKIRQCIKLIDNKL